MTRSELDDAIRTVNLRYTNSLYVFDSERALAILGMRLAADIACKEAARDRLIGDAIDAIRRAADELQTGDAK